MVNITVYKPGGSAVYQDVTNVKMETGPRAKCSYTPAGPIQRLGRKSASRSLQIISPSRRILFPYAFNQASRAAFQRISFASFGPRLLLAAHKS